MRAILPKTIALFLALPLLLSLLTGCSNQPPASATESQKATEADARAKINSAYQNDPTLKPPVPGGGAHVGGSMASPGPVPGAGGSSPNPGPVPGGR